MSDTHAIIPVITDAGMAALINAKQSGVKLVIDHIALGMGLQKPSKKATTLLKFVKNLSINSVQDVTLGEVRATAVDSSQDRYSITEVGFMTPDNKLFAIWSTDDAAAPLLQKTPESQLTVPYNIAISGEPQITISSTGASVYPQATPTKQGVIQLATEEQGLNKGNSEHAITPEVLNYVLNTLRQPQKFYVDNVNGDDAADGSEAHPVATIDQAIQLSSSLCECNYIYVKTQQTHTLQTQAMVRNKSIYFNGWGTGRAIITNKQISGDRASGMIPTGNAVIDIYQVDIVCAELPDSVYWTGIISRHDSTAGTVKTYGSNITCHSPFIHIPSGPGVLSAAIFSGVIKYNPSGKRPNVINNEYYNPMHAHITSAFQDLNGNAIDNATLKRTIFATRAFNKNASASQQPFNILTNIDLSQGN